MVPTIPAMQAMQVLASSSVAAAAGSMIWLSFAVSPPITLVPERPAPVDASGNVSSWRKQTIETVSAAVADTFEHRWHDIPAVPHPDSLDGLIDDLSTLPLAQDAPKLAQAEPPDLAAASQPEQENPVDGAAEAASATIRRLRPLRPVPDRLYTKQSPLLALPASARSATTPCGKNGITGCVCTTAFQNSLRGQFNFPTRIAVT